MIGALRRAIVRLVSDSPRRQTAQVTVREGEVRDDTERWQQYGLSSVPLSGAEALYLPVGDDDASDGVLLLVEDRRYRMRGLAGGEVALYDDRGQHVHLTRTGIVVYADGDCDITATGTATIAAASAIVSAPDIRLGSSGAANGCVMAGNPAHTCPVMPLTGHLVGSTVVRGEG